MMMEGMITAATTGMIMVEAIIQVPAAVDQAAAAVGAAAMMTVGTITE
jgi:hypothetical protein